MVQNDDREAMRLAVARKRVAYQVPGMDALPTRRALAYRATSGAELLMDVYVPSPSGQNPPLVVLPMAYPDPGARVRGYGPLTSWAQLFAASGMAAVVYGTEAPEADVHAVLRHVRADADAIGVNGDRIGLFAGSGNVTVGLSTLMHDRRLTCAAFLYGYTMDLNGSTAIAGVSAQCGFVNACAGRSAADLPANAQTLFVRAGLDESPGLNAALDEVIRQAVGRNLPVWFINHATGSHGFDLDDSSGMSRRVVEHVLSFMRLQLQASELPSPTKG